MDMLIDRWAWHVVRVVNRLDDLRNKVKARRDKKTGGNGGNRRISQSQKKMQPLVRMRGVRGSLNFNPKTKSAPVKIKTNFKSSRYRSVGGHWLGHRHTHRPQALLFLEHGTSAG